MTRTGFTRLVTTRHGLDAASAMGLSQPPYESFNLGAGVGDDPDAVRANRSALAGRLGLASDQLVWMSQVHGTTIVEVRGPSVRPMQGTDGMVNATSGIALAVLAADCVPVLAADRAAGVIGVAHAGRLGAAAGIVPALVDRMIGLGAHAADTQILIGPAICGRCYEVPPQMRDEVESQLPGSACETEKGTAGLDLRAGIARQLRAAGVVLVEVDKRCTREDPELFSHRRSAPTGRFAGVVRL